MPVILGACWRSLPQPAARATRLSGSKAAVGRAASTRAILPFREGREPLPGLGAGMGLEVGVLEALRRQVRVDLRGRDVGVNKNLLDRAQVAPAGQQVMGEVGVQGVGA